MEADYTKQLGEIAAALNHSAPWWQNPWILATFSAVLGVTGGFVGQFLLALFTDLRKKRKLRRMGYNYAAHLCVQLDQFLSAPYDPSVIPEALNAMAIDSPREYMNSNHDVYSELNEKPCFELIFNRAEALSRPGKQTLDDIRLTQVMVVAQFTKHLAIGQIGKYFGVETQKALAEVLEKYRSDVETLTAPPISASNKPTRCDVLPLSAFIGGH